LIDITALLLSSSFTYLTDHELYKRAYGSGKEDAPICDVPACEKARMKLLRHVSFVDCPV
jgi:hypothetical protein